jgi:catechol 2,3-dioxygenase-like lactoylglutathione lyase family enzyme
VSIVNKLRMLSAMAMVVVCATRVPARAPAQSPTEVERPMILGISHIAFRVTAIEAASHFYADVLGLTRVNSGAADCARFRVNHRQEIIIEPGLPADVDDRLSHLAFETSDLAALAAYFKSRGVTTMAAPAVPCAATQALWVKDPDGHTIEFVQRDPSAVPAATPAAATMLSTRALHAGLTIRDPEAADRFYKDVLGFSEFWRGGSSDTVTNWINMKVPNGTDYLEYMLVSGTVTRQRLGSAHHVALMVPDIQLAYETALSRTPPAARSKLASPNVGRNGRWQLNLFDPDGSRVELMEPSRVR